MVELDIGLHNLLCYCLHKLQITAGFMDNEPHIYLSYYLRNLSHPMDNQVNIFLLHSMRNIRLDISIHIIELLDQHINQVFKDT